jgi:DtxR family transcriptional regulator, Mn-dependent transcriptional regulator
LASATVENYVKAVYLLSQGDRDRPAETGQLAKAMGVSPGTVTSMFKTLAEAGLASYVPYEGIRLTESGRTLAERIVTRRRLIEEFLCRSLELDPGEVHDDAERMEHVLGDALIARIDQYLHHPCREVRGDATVFPAAGASLAETPFHQPSHSAR